MTGTQISNMDPSVTLPDGAVVPFVVPPATPGFDPSLNYIYDLGADLLNRVSYTALALPTAAAEVGSTGPSNVQADIDGRPTFALLATSSGAGLVGAILTGADAVVRPVEDFIREEPASPESFAGDASEALLAVVTAHSAIRLARGATYTLTSLVDLSTLNGRVIYMNGAIIEADVGFADTHLISMSGDSQIIGPGTFNGTNVPAPSSPYASGVYAGVGIYITGTGDNGVIDGVNFIEFQSGPILHDSATTRSGFQVKNCTFTDNQKHTADATNSIVAMHGVSNGLMVDCQCTTYNWKAFYFANGSYNKIVRCHTSGGVVGHASHFLIGGNDNSIIDCTHTGTGFGVKLDDEINPTVINFNMDGGVTAVYAQSCIGFLVLGGSCVNPSARPILIDAANGDCSGTVIGFRGTRSTPGTTAEHVGVRIESMAAGVSKNILIQSCYFENFLWGVHVPNSGYAQKNIRILDNEFVNTGQYGVLAYIGSGEISGNTINMDGVSVEAAVHVERDSVTTNGTVVIENNGFSGCTADNIELETRLRHKAILVKNNHSDGGTTFLRFNCNGNAADSVSYLEVTGNSGTGLTTGSAFTFNGTTATRLRNENNSFLNGSYVPVGDTYATITNLSIVGTLTHSGTPEGVFAAPVSSQFRRTDGGAGTSFYVKESGTGNTGWAAK